MSTEAVATWAWKDFGHAEIEDRRWTGRLVRMAAQAARRPAGRVTETFSDDAERQGAYGLLESEAVSSQQVASAMFVACAKRAADETFVYVPVDGSSLTLADGQQAKGFGPIGSRAEGARGLKVMSAMVLSSKAVPLGVSGQRWWVRPETRRKKNRDQLPAEAKETGHWLEVMEQTRQVMAAHAPRVRCWFQLDREADSWPILTTAARDGHWFTVRSCRKRRVRLAQGRRAFLAPFLAQQLVMTTYRLSVIGGRHRAARLATLEVRACTMTLDLRDKRTGKRFPMVINVVQVLEQGTTPPGESPIHWTLLTNRPIETVAQLHQVIDGYATRWRIEELHKSWKSGACRVEQTQLRSAQATIKWATILLAVAVRIERIKHLAREQPNRPATDEFTQLEIRAAALLRFGRAARTHLAPGVVPTLAEVTLWIAKIGGYTGQTSSGGPPGTITIARGLKEVRVAAKALAVADSL